MTDKEVKRKVANMIDTVLSNSSSQDFQEIFSGGKIGGNVTEGYSPKGRRVNVMTITIGWEIQQPSTQSGIC